MQRFRFVDVEKYAMSGIARPVRYDAFVLSKKHLQELYEKKRLPVSAVAHMLGCSQNKVSYWLSRHGIAKRSIRDAMYNKWNPLGDPFKARRPSTVREAVLYGLGIGLYWGEGTKANKNSIRLGNTNPALIKKFIDFLVAFYQIDRQRLRFGLQIFSDTHADDTLEYWARYLKVPKSQFYPKVIVTPHRGIGNYRQKTKHGVVTLYFNNSKLRDIICRAIDEESMR